MTRWPSTVPVLIPVYNHAGTIGAVVEGCRALGAPFLVVVDDGSDDGSGDAARAAGADLVVRMPINAGKGAALVAGLDHLKAAGWACALTLDADLQHPPAEALRLALAAADAADRLWVGCRDMAGAPAASRFGRWWTGLWTWVACGTWATDNQSGLRVWPLPAMRRLPIRAGRYAFEVESLVRAVWGGIAIGEVPVQVVYPPDRISHFHALHDNCRTAWAFTRLVVRRLIPWPHTQGDGTHPWRSAVTGGLTPGAAAAAAAVGAALGVAPLPGMQTAVAAWLAMSLRLNPVVTLLASNISLGPLLVAWFALEIVIGHALAGGGWLDHARLTHTLAGTAAEHGMAAALQPVIGDWLLGAGPVMAVAGAGAGGLAWAAARMLGRG